MKNYKYFIFYLLWIILFYLMISFENSEFNIKLWTEISRLHFITYGPILGGILSTFYYIDDNFKV